MKHQNKDASYETAVASEKRDSKEQSNHIDSDTNCSPKLDDYVNVDMSLIGSDDNDQSSQLSCSPPSAGPSRQTLFTSTPEKDKRRRASTAWQTKLERRRRKNSTNPSISITLVDDKDIDDLDEESIDSSMADSPPIEYTRQKRHSCGISLYQTTSSKGSASTSF